MSDPYKGMTTPEALRYLAKRYLKKPECIQLVEKAALEIEAGRKLSEEARKLITPKGNFEITESELSALGDTCNVSESQYWMVKMHAYDPGRFDEFAGTIADLPFMEAFRKVQWGDREN